MGYYTDFEVKTENDPDGKGLEALKAKSGYTWFKDTLSQVKWYDYAEDLTSVSKDFPGVRFTVKGEGEDSGDFWRSYALNGELQNVSAKLTFAPCTLWEGNV